MREIQLKMMLFVGVLAVVASPAGAQPAGEEKSVNIEARTLTRFFPESKEKNGGQEIAMIENEAGVYIDFQPQGDVSGDLDFLFKHVYLSDNATTIDLPAWLVGRSMRVGGAVPLPLLNDPDYRVGAAVLPTYYTDSWENSFNDFETGAFRWLSEYWLEYRGSDRFRIKAGIIYRPEYDYAVLPVLDIRYRFNDTWSFRATSDDLGIVYKLNERVQFFTEHRYVIDEYEIATNGQKGRTLLHQQNTTGVGMQIDFSELAYAKFSIGAAYNRKFKLLNPTDAEMELKESMYATLELSARF